MAAGRVGLLLVNLGTPEAPTPSAVRRYLREFLSDPRVIDVPALGRWLLLNLIILPFRPRRSAEAYEKIWTAQGSPLLVHGHALLQAVRARVGAGVVVELGMRYGQPSLGDAIRRLRNAGASELVVLPLYPQYAASTTASTAARVFELLGESWDVPPVRVVPPFFDRPAVLDAFAQVARPVIDEARADHVLFSFHGVPERQIHKSDRTMAHCLRDGRCCDAVGEVNALCYRAQSFFMARGIAQRLGLAADGFSVGFQSRLGRTRWIGPYTDALARELPGRGVRRLVVTCPSFVADCLETLEEIGLRLRDTFLAAGGEHFALAPSLNANAEWVEEVVRLGLGGGAPAQPRGALAR
jgi:protoporphyrin/coproporphyrin ferrochelatase